MGDQKFRRKGSNPEPPPGDKPKPPYNPPSVTKTKGIQTDHPLVIAITMQFLDGINTVNDLQELNQKERKNALMGIGATGYIFAKTLIEGMKKAEEEDLTMEFLFEKGALT